LVPELNNATLRLAVYFKMSETEKMVRNGVFVLIFILHSLQIFVNS